MKQVIFIICLSGICFLSGIQTVNAQTDTGSKNINTETIKRGDDEKNALFNRQSNEVLSLHVEMVMDSIRILDLNKEISELGDADGYKKKILEEERNQIRNKDSSRFILLKKKVDSIRTKVIGFPVKIGNDTLFLIYSKLGSYTPLERAEKIQARLMKMAKDFYYRGDSIKIIPSDLTIDINYKDGLIMSISEIDAIWMNESKENLAEECRSRILRGIKKYKNDNSLKNTMMSILEGSLLLILIIFLIYLINKLFNRLGRRTTIQKRNQIRGFKIWNYQFLDTERQKKAILTIFSLLKWFLILNVIYFSLPVLSYIVPSVSGIAGKLFSFFLDPIKKIIRFLWDYLPNLFTIIILVIVFRFTFRVLNYFKTEIEKGNLKIPGFYVEWANPTFQIIRVLMLAFMLIVIFPYLPGSDSQVFKGVSVFLGVLVTFGSAGALGNIVSGLVLTYMRAYRIGDRVRIGEAIGDVVEKTLLVTRLKTIKNEIISIPNSSVMTAQTTNFTEEAAKTGLIVHSTITIGYDSPWRQVHELMIKAALATNLIEKDPPPFVFQTSLNDFYISYEINAYTKAASQQPQIYSDLHQHIQDAFNEAGVEIMSPHYKMVRDGNSIAIPKEYVPKDYVAPGFNVNLKEKEANP